MRIERGHADLADLELEADVAEGGDHAGAVVLSPRPLLDSLVRHLVSPAAGVVGVLFHELFHRHPALRPAQDVLRQDFGLLLGALGEGDAAVEETDAAPVRRLTRARNSTGAEDEVGRDSSDGRYVRSR